MFTSRGGGCGMRDKTRYRPLFELTRARMLEFFRSPGTIFWVFIFPVLLAVALGIAFREQEPQAVRVAVVEDLRRGQTTDGDGAPMSAALTNVPGLLVQTTDGDGAHSLLMRGRVDAVVQWGDVEGQTPLVTLRQDPTHPNAALARLIVENAVQRAFGRLDVAEISIERVDQPGGRYVDFLIPGLVGINIMGSCMWGIGYSVVDARKRKLLKRFAATPMVRSHFMLSYMLSRLLFLGLEVVLLFLFGYLVFDVAIHGSMLAVAGVSLLGAFGFSGLSVLIASRTDSTEVASGWMNFAMLPMWVLSGAFFDYSRFPEVVHPFIRLLPLTALNDALRAVASQGLSVMSLLPQLAVLSVWGVVGFVFSVRFFRWH